MGVGAGSELIGGCVRWEWSGGCEMGVAWCVCELGVS